jgi:hypothetical protein
VTVAVPLFVTARSSRSMTAWFSIVGGRIISIRHAVEWTSSNAIVDLTLIFLLGNSV